LYKIRNTETKEIPMTTSTSTTDIYDPILFTTHRPDIIMEKGAGMYLWDTNDKKYLDFIGGWAVNALGHSPKRVAEALATQSEKLLNASPAFYNAPMLEFAKLLTENSCFDKVFFGSSGAEANESAIKLARKYGLTHKNGAYEIITTNGSFHGRTLATMSATGKEQWKTLFEPKVPGFIHVPFNNISAIEQAVSENTCAIMIEPIQGEGGVYEADETYIKDLRKFCDEKGILLIFDEVQTGMGRTGTLFCYEHYGCKPDIMTLGKNIGSGFPLSAMLTTRALDIFEPGEQGGTYTGQPLAMAVGIAVISEIFDKNLLQHVTEKGLHIKRKLAELPADLGIQNIRGKGLLLAFDIDTADATKVAAQCLEKGLIINAPNAKTIRLIPPLIVQNSHISDMLTLLQEALLSPS
ncbi:MAG: acetylornithine/N-succinyldiaminopimelate aminotransferase, partial [Candidatus Marinamargulisbacteria bacterium]